MSDKKHAKFKKWRASFSFLTVSLLCLFSLILSWGNHWLMSVLLSLGVIVCGVIAFFDLKRFFKKER